MLAIALWMFGVAIAVSVMVVTVAMEFYSIQFGLGAIIASFIAVTGMRDYGDAEARNASTSRRAAILVRHMGILWAWAAVSICMIYSTIMIWTQTWIPLFIVLTLATGICIFIANLLQRDAEVGINDLRVIAFVDRMVWAQFVVICLLIGSLIAVGKFGPASFGGENKWPAMNIMLCTGLGLGILSGFSIINAMTRADTPATPDPARKLPDSVKTSGLPSQAPRRRRPQARVV